MIGNSEGAGVPKAKIFRGKYEAKLDFPEEWGGGVKPKTIHGGGGMDIFWNHTTQHNVEVSPETLTLQSSTTCDFTTVSPLSIAVHGVYAQREDYFSFLIISSVISSL